MPAPLPPHLGGERESVVGLPEFGARVPEQVKYQESVRRDARRLQGVSECFNRLFVEKSTFLSEVHHTVSFRHELHGGAPHVTGSKNRKLGGG